MTLQSSVSCDVLHQANLITSGGQSAVVMVLGHQIILNKEFFHEKLLSQICLSIKTTGEKKRTPMTFWPRFVRRWSGGGILQF